MEIATNFKTVVDPVTKLEWKCDEEGGYTFDDAVARFAKPNSLGFRLPTINELKTLRDANDDVTKKLYVLKRTYFWSSTPYVGVPQFAWIFNVSRGIVNFSYLSFPNHVRLVRACQ